MASIPLEPDQIRIIREGLGLSQREAGQLLGGGPNAFAKYESGTLAPAAALANLLLVLKDNPGGLATLRPDRAPVPVRLPLPFEVTSQHIEERISKQAFPDLLRRLLRAEALSHGIPLHGIHVADNVDAPDGGEDGRIQWEGGAEQTQFLPTRFIQFQLKTGDISPGAAGKEVLAKSDQGIKPMIRSALEGGAIYIVLSTHPYTKQQLEAREKRVRDALRGAGLAIEDARVQFRDASQLASWVNTHPAVATWLLEKVEPGLRGPFQSWSHWAGRTENASSWVEDERLKPLCQFLHQRAVDKPRSIARIVGLWGIGKSRLALEAFHPTRSDLSSLILYAVEPDAGSVAIKTTVQRLADSGVRAVVVVDQCPPETHRAIAGMVERETSQLSLLTLDDENPAGTLNESTHRVNEAPDAVTEAIINQVAPGLQGEDQRRLAQFSRGFPKLSILIAQAWQGSIPLGHATDNDLVEVYILGRNPQERDLILKSARLLATFGLVGIGIDPQEDNQVDRIASLGRNLNSQDLRAGARPLAERGVARCWGRYISVEPLPIVMKLAEQQWKEWGKGQWETVLTDGAMSVMMFDGDLRLNAQAAKQLKLLNQSPITVAQEVVKHVCRYGGPFEGLQGILAPGHAEVLSHLAEIDTRAVVGQIGRSLDGVEDLASITGDARRHLVWALEKIAFPNNTFEDGAYLLLRLAAAENEGWANNATGQFVALFQVIGGNTEADSTTRLALLDEFSKGNDVKDKEKKILIKALGNVLNLDYFSRPVGSEVHGARPELKPWHPETVEEYRSYIGGCATRLARFAVMGNVVGALARTALGKRLGSLVRHDFINMIEESIVKQVGAAVTHWPEALNSLSRYLSYQSANAPDDLIDRVQKLIRKLEPQRLEKRLHFLMNEMPWDYRATEEEKYDYNKIRQRQENEVRALASEAIQQPETLRALLPQLSRGKQWTDVFGQALAEECTDSWDEWLKLLIQAVEETSEAERNYGLLLGYICGLASRQPDAVEAFKQRVAHSPALSPMLPLICRAIGCTSSDLALIISALQYGHLSPHWLNATTIGNTLCSVSPTSTAPLFDALLDHSSEGFTGALSLLGMYLHPDSERLESFRPQIRKIAENTFCWPWANHLNNRNDQQMMTYDFEQLITWMLEKGPEDQDAAATAMALAKGYMGEALESVLPILLSRFSGIAWPLIGSAIISAKGGYIYGFPLLSLPENTLFAWCHAHPEHAPAFAARHVPFLDSGESGALSVHPVMVRLLEEFGDRRDVIEVSRCNMCSGLSIGSKEAFYEQNREPVKLLLNHPNNKVRRWAKDTLDIIQNMVEPAIIIDAEREARFRG